MIESLYNPFKGLSGVFYNELNALMRLDNLSDLSKLSKMFNKSGLFEFRERAQNAVRFLECFLISTYKRITN